MQRVDYMVKRIGRTRFVVLVMIPLCIMFISLFVGRYPMTIVEVINALFRPGLASNNPMHVNVIWELRLPRAILGALVGGSLAISGCTLQGLFKNPLVDTGILGVNAGAGFGAALAIVLFNNVYMTNISAFIFAVSAVLLSYWCSKIYGRSSNIMLVLGGVVVSSIFVALLSFVKYIADPFDELPSIIFWLMGSISRADYNEIKIAIIPIGVGIVGLLLLRWRINIISIGEREAHTLGVNVRGLRVYLVLCSTLVAATSVCVSGTIGWIGLVIPHVSRMLVGNDNNILLPTSLSLGAGFLILVDILGRSITSAELPLNILTALIGGPFYIFLLKKTRGGAW